MIQAALCRIFWLEAQVDFQDLESGLLQREGSGSDRDRFVTEAEAILDQLKTANFSEDAVSEELANAEASEHSETTRKFDVSLGEHTLATISWDNRISISILLFVQVLESLFVFDYDEG